MDRRSRGFTMVELLVVLALSFVGLISLVSLQVVSVRANSQARAVTEATALAQDKLEALRRIPIWLLTASTDTGINAQGQPSNTGAYTRKVTVTPAGTSMIVTVRVSWQDTGGRAHAVSISTVRAP